MYYIYLNDSSGPVKREIEPTVNTTESSIVIDGLDSSQTYMLAIGVVTDGGKRLGDVSETGTTLLHKLISLLDPLGIFTKTAKYIVYITIQSLHITSVRQIYRYIKSV